MESLATSIPSDPYVSDETISRNLHPEFSKTALEYRVNKTTDPSLNKTVINPPGRSIDYSERELVKSPQNLNGTGGLVLFTNTSIISFPTTETQIDGNSDGDGGVIDAWDPNRPPAAPIPVTKEGHWFPNMDHSRIRYEIETTQWTWYPYHFRLDISRGNDPYDRYFRIYWDGNMIHDQIISAQGYHNDFVINAWPGIHRLEFEIWSGYYSDYAWKMDLFRPASSDPLIDPGSRVTAEFFPFTAYGRLRWTVYMGQQTEAEVKIENVDDPYVRDLKFFVDGVQKQPTRNAPCDLTFDLGSYTHGSVHEIMLEVSWCNYMEWGYKMPKFRVHYGGTAAEIDYLVCDNGAHNHRPHDETLNYMQVYFVEHGYQRYHLFIDDAITNDWGTEMVWSEYNTVQDQHFDLDYMDGVKYILFGHYWTSNHNILGITRSAGADDMFIADQAGDDYAFWWGWFYHFNDVQVEKVVTMHECGHSIDIIEWTDADGDGDVDDELYCNNSFCIMATCGDNGDDNPWYCQIHWDLRDFPEF
jgi:hypothetical protein